MTITYRKIVVPLDGSPLAECVFPHVEAIVKACSVKSVELVSLVYPVEVHSRAGIPIDENQEKVLNDAAIRDAEDYLTKARKMLAAMGVVTSIKVLPGTNAGSLADYIEHTGTDLVVIATHGRSGPSRWAWGSFADRLLRSTCTPVMMVRAPGCVAGV